MKSLFSLVVAALVAASAQGQSPPIVLRSALLDWPNLRVVVAPDSEGTYLSANTGPGTSRNPGKFFSGSFVPSELSTWDVTAREFLKLRLTDADSGETCSSPTVSSTEGGRVYLFRRRVNNSWTAERFLVMQGSDTAPPLSVSGTEESIAEILDSVGAVNKRTPVLPSYPRSTDSARMFDRHARPKQSNRPPPYPVEARQRNVEGMVLLAFVIGADGRADMSTVVVEYETYNGFTDSVLRQLPSFRFEPAVRNGKPVRERVFMPFLFSLVRFVR
jgi:TonB family protein